MEHNYFNCFSNEDIPLTSREQKLTNLHSMKFKKVIALNHKKPVLCQKINAHSKNKDYTNIKELLKSKQHQTSIRNVFNSFFKNSQSSEPFQKAKALPQQNSSNHLSININISNVHIQNHNVSGKNRMTNIIKFPLVLKNSIMSPSFPQANNLKLRFEKNNKVYSIDSISKRNIFPLESKESFVCSLSKRTRELDDNNEDSVIDELVDLLGNGSRTTKKNEVASEVSSPYPQKVNQLRPMTSYGGLHLRQRQLQKSASCRLPNNQNN